MTQLMHMIPLGLSTREKQAGIVFAYSLAVVVDALMKRDDTLIYNQERMRDVP